MRLAKRIANLGYGSQREVKEFIRIGLVTALDGAPYGPDDEPEHNAILFNGHALDPAPGMVAMLHKPLEFTCATSDPGRVIYELLPPRFLRRNPLVSPVGRLDRDTAGLVVLTDDGPLLHKIISPRSKIAKTYRVQLARPLTGEEAAIFAAGTLMLRSEKTPLLPAQLETVGPTEALVTIVEGRYHQVRRMFAAVGNHVESLRRERVGGLSLGDLAEGNWRLLTAEETASIFA